MVKISFKQNNKVYFNRLAVKVLIIAVLIGLDILTKSLAQQHLAGGDDATLISGVLSLKYAENTGAAFGLFSQSIVMLIILSSLFVIAFFAYDYFNHNKSLWYYASFTLIISGAVGNFIDRISFGYVRDFIKLDFINFPIFNLADTFLTIGIIAYTIYIFISLGKNKTVENAQ